MTPYLDEEQAENLKTYRYYGGDAGYMNTYFYNPVATKIVDNLPENLAPNLITLFGFIFSSMPFFVLFKNYGINFENNGISIPNWFFFFEAFCFFMYRMLDEMDGK